MSMLIDPKLVDEDYRVEDLLNFTAYISQLKSKLISMPSIAMVGIVGDYGTGKSTMLENLRKSTAGNYEWIHFDAWKYPERNNLWEGFVLDFVRQFSPKDFDTVIKRIDGTSGDAAKTLISTVGLAANLFAPGSGAVIDKLTYFAQTSPAKRIFQIQDILTVLLSKKADKPIYIVVEDADRSGEAGIFFIETLSQFIKNLGINVDIKILIPVSKKSFNSDTHDAYIKALDYIEFFNISSRNLEHFVEKIFRPELISNEISKYHIVEWLQRLANKHSLTIRDIKSIIRNSDVQYVALQTRGIKPDPRVVLVIESSRYITDVEGHPEENTYQYIINHEFKVRKRTHVELILYAIGMNTTLEGIAEILGDLDGNANVFKRQVRFIDLDIVDITTHTTIPFQHQGQFTLPLYYIY